MVLLDKFTLHLQALKPSICFLSLKNFLRNKKASGNFMRLYKKICHTLLSNYCRKTAYFCRIYLGITSQRNITGLT